MARASKTNALIQTTLGQHLALSVAAHLARTQLVRDPFNAYDGGHLLETLEVVANALLRVTPVYTRDVVKAEPRQLTEADMFGARVTNGAQNLLLSDGRKLSAVTMKRSDLRQAIAILKVVGLPELTARTKIKEEHSDSAPFDRTRGLIAQLDELEQLLRSPLWRERVDRANRLSIHIARSAPRGTIANLAMRLMSAMHDARNGRDEPSIQIMLERLRSAVDEVTKTAQS